jgi:hypothetical protein
VAKPPLLSPLFPYPSDARIKPPPPPRATLVVVRLYKGLTARPP